MAYERCHACITAYRKCIMLLNHDTCQRCEQRKLPCSLTEALDPTNPDELSWRNRAKRRRCEEESGDSLVERVSLFERHLTQRDNNCAALGAEFRELKAELLQERERREEGLNEIVRLQQELDQTRARLHCENHRLRKEHDQTMAGLRGENDKLRSKKDQLQKEHNRTMEGLHGENNQLRGQLSQQKAELEQAKEQLGSKGNMVDDLRELLGMVLGASNTHENKRQSSLSKYEKTIAQAKEDLRNMEKQS